MKVALFSVGTELLLGQTVNTNVVFLSQQLNLLGFDVLYHHTVGDNPQRLRELIDLARRDCDMILTTGGLGPTQDDLTKEVACEAFHDELVLDEKTLSAIEADFARWGRPMAKNNVKQAYLPRRATVFDNDQGTAPGFALEDDGRYILCLPGPPREMTRMFERRVRPFLAKMSGGTLYFRDIMTYGIGESDLEMALIDLIEGQTDPTFATYAKEGESFLRIASKHRSEETAKAAVEQAIGEVEHRIGKYIYSTDGTPLPKVVGSLLLERGLTLSSAESCTGGMFAAEMVEQEGISAVFDRGLVTYSNRAKMEELGVRAETLQRYGAVSEETAREMAEGLSAVSGSDICVSVTGIAGPDGGTGDKPVGLAYIGLCFRGATTVSRLDPRDTGRHWNRHRAMLRMFHEVYRCVIMNDEKDSEQPESAREEE